MLDQRPAGHPFQLLLFCSFVAWQFLTASGWSVTDSLVRLSFRGKRFLNLLQSDVQPFLRTMPVFGHFAQCCFCLLEVFLSMKNLKFPFLGVLLFCLVYRISTVLLKISIADCWVEPTLFYWSLFWDNPVEGQEGLLTLLNLSSPAMWWMGLRGPLIPRASGLRPSVSRRQVSVGMQKDKRWFPIFQMSWKLKIKLVVFC